MADSKDISETKKAENLSKFKALVDKTIDDQLELFLKSFIFDLGDDWKQVVELSKLFRKRLSDAAEGKDDLNPIMAADFLQKHGRERTALQRKEEVADIDLDFNGRIAFIEYILLHYKAMILTAFYKRIGKPCPYDLSKGGIGVSGVGPQLLDELFTLPIGLDPALEKAIEEFMAKKRAREQRMAQLEATAAAGGVKGLTAVNELKQMESADLTDMNRIELTLNAAKKRSATQSGDVALQAKKKQQEEEEKKKRDESRNRLKNMAAMFGGGAPADPKALMSDIEKKGGSSHKPIAEKPSAAVVQASTHRAIQSGSVKDRLKHLEAAPEGAGLTEAQKQAYLDAKKAKSEGVDPDA